MLKRISSNRGVSIMEVMMVVVIVGIIATLAGPRMSRAYDKMKFKANSRDINSKIALARSYAVSQKEQCGVYFGSAFYYDPSIGYDQPLTYTVFKDIVNPELYQYDVGDEIISIDTLHAPTIYLYTWLPGNSLVFKSNGSVGIPEASTLTLNGETQIFTYGITDEIVAWEFIYILPSTGKMRTDYYSYNYYTTETIN